MSWDVVGIGNALVDALVRVPDDAVTDELGLVRGGMTLCTHDEWEAAFARVRAHGAEVQSGGSCANSMATLGYLGAKVRYYGQVGRDEMGRVYADRMSEACGGHLIRSADHPTGKCLSIVSARDGQRTMLTDLGATVHLDTLGDFDAAIRDSRLLHVEGYLFMGEATRSRAMEAIAVANQEELPVSLDAGDAVVVQVAGEALRHAIREFVSVLFLNEDEARVLGGGEPEAAAHALAEDVRTVVLKLGARGSFVVHEGSEVRTPAHRVDVIDTTGAGDSYGAGFLYGRARGWETARCADLGARVAALAVGQLGAVVRDRDALAAAVRAASLD